MSTMLNDKTINDKTEKKLKTRENNIKLQIKNHIGPVHFLEQQTYQ